MYILQDFPDHIETERLLIRAPRPGDGAAVAEAHRESYPELKSWMPWALENPTVADSESFVRQSAAKFITREDLPLFMFRKDDGLFLGGTGFHRIKWDVPHFEIGYWLRTSATGHGYMTEAVFAMIRFAFETLRAERVEIRCDPRNEKSAAVARRAGLTLEGRLRHNMRDTSGELCDSLVFGIIRSEYQP